jgi:peptidoglycan/xylan/chitin deacetylase (PgdA/CDA1 family)
MGRPLYDLSWPGEVRRAEARLGAEGIEVRPFRPADTYPLVAYFRAEFPTWIEFFRHKLDAGHDADEMVVATHGREVVGYCQHLEGDHVGPFGVAAAYRSRGVGAVMVYRLLEGLRAKGLRFAWFGETGRARPFYERAGFRVTRTYTLLQRDLAIPGAGSPVALHPGLERERGVIVRGPGDRRALAMCFTGHEFGEGLPTILDELQRRGAPASFFLTGEFLRRAPARPHVDRLVAAGHYLGPHSDRHLLYCAWTPDRRTLVTRAELAADLGANLEAIVACGVPRAGVRFYIPPYEHANEEIVAWSEGLGLVTVNRTAGTLSGADWTPRDDPRYRSTAAILESIYRREGEDDRGLNGFLLLLHVGAGPGRPDPFAARLGELLDFLGARGYALRRVDALLAP